MWQKQKQCIFIRLNKYSFPQQMYVIEIDEGCSLTPCREVNDEILTIRYFIITEFIYSKTEDRSVKAKYFQVLLEAKKKNEIKKQLGFY